MSTKVKTKETTPDERMKRELADHDRWVAECEAKQRKDIQQLLGEREDQLHREHVRERILQRAAEREKQQQPKIKSPKSRRTKAGGS